MDGPRREDTLANQEAVGDRKQARPAADQEAHGVAVRVPLDTGRPDLREWFRAQRRQPGPATYQATEDGAAETRQADDALCNAVRKAHYVGRRHWAQTLSADARVVCLPVRTVVEEHSDGRVAERDPTEPDGAVHALRQHEHRRGERSLTC